MSERALEAEAARLDEIAKVTEAYSRYSLGAGFAMVVAGAWMGSALVAEWRGWVVWQVFAYANTPLLWIVLVRRSRAHYQRRGMVKPWEEGNVAYMRRTSSFMALLLALVGTATLAVVGAKWARSGDFAVALVAWSVAMSPLAAAWLVRRWTSGASLPAKSVALMVFTVGGVEPLIEVTDRTGSFPHQARSGMWALVALLWVALGVLSHLKHRRLERRLAALQGRA